MRYKDKRGWLFEVRRPEHSVLYAICSYNPEKGKWRVWTVSNWYGNQKAAEKAAWRFAKERGWEEVE